jgi:hypothetical protein
MTSRSKAVGGTRKAGNGSRSKALGGTGKVGNDCPTLTYRDERDVHDQPPTNP